MKPIDLSNLKVYLVPEWASGAGSGAGHGYMPKNLYVYGGGRRFFGPSRLLWFTLGLIGGIFITQNYRLPRLESPSKVCDRFKKFAEENKIDKKPELSETSTTHGSTEQK